MLYGKLKLFNDESTILYGGMIMNTTKEMKQYDLCVTWEMCGTVKVMAHSLEEAMETFYKDLNHIKLPDGEYVDSSFKLSTDDVEEMEAMVNPFGFLDDKKEV